METSICIRPALERDAHGLWLLRAEAIRQGACEHYSPAQIEAWVARRIPESYVLSISQGRILVAESGEGSLAGFAQLRQESGEVEAIYVHPAWTRRGIGTRLLEALEVRARAAGLSRLRLDAALNAVRFYEQVGFRKVRRVVFPLEGGGEYACVVMTKALK